MHQEDPEVDQRLARFEAQLDRFSLALHQWQKGQAHPGAPDLTSHVQRLEAALEREAEHLRARHEEPLRELQAQAANLRDICATAASSVHALDQVESRLAALQTSVETHLAELSRTLQSIAVDLRGGPPATVPADAPAGAWPLDKVLHLHEQLRRSSEPVETMPVDAQPSVPEAATAVGGRLFSAGAAHEEPQAAADGKGRGLWLASAAVVAVAGLVIAFGWWTNARLTEAAARATAAERQAAAATEAASREAAQAREQADRQMTEARQSAQRAEVISTVLAAPDLVRYNLAGSVAAERAYGQVLWSRTRGLVLSASRVPPAPPSTTYQLWLLTTAAPVSGGLFVPDSSGRATLATDAPPQVVGPVVGAEVTIEPAGGQSTPSDRVLLVRR